MRGFPLPKSGASLDCAQETDTFLLIGPGVWVRLNGGMDGMYTVDDRIKGE